MNRRKILTGHEIFDEISDLREGSSILIFDSTHFGAFRFANTLFKNSDRPYMIITSEFLDEIYKFHRLDLVRLSDLTSLSVEIEQIKKAMKNHAILLHNYLPQILIREDEDRVLKVVQHWQEQVHDTELLDVYLLARGTFPDFEKKMQALMSGCIEIDFQKEHKYPQFSMLGECKPKYHMIYFPFIHRDDKMLVKWGDEFTETLPKETAKEINERITYINENITFLKISKSNIEPIGLNIFDKWLLSQISETQLTQVSQLFPEKFNELIKKLAIWNIRGYINLVKIEPQPLPRLSNTLNFKTQIAMIMPTSLSLPLLTHRPKSIPLDVYDYLRQSVTAFTSERYTLKEINTLLPELEKQFQDMASRTTAINKLIRNKESPKLKFDLKYLPKLVTISLNYGYRLTPKIEKVDDAKYLMTINDCFICTGVKTDHPVCHILEGTVTGACGILFKRKFECHEIQCKAMGEKSCIFNIQGIS